jgi:hypothetical protein
MIFSEKIFLGNFKRIIFGSVLWLYWVCRDFVGEPISNWLLVLWLNLENFCQGRRFCDFRINNYIRDCEDPTELKFHRTVVYLKHILEKIRYLKFWTRGGHKEPLKSWTHQEFDKLD